jgi:purine-nucleoside phosphorylase
MEDIYELALSSSKFISDQTEWSAETAIVLGTGLGELSGLLSDVRRLPYASIPNFPLSTIPSHKGELLAGYLHQTPVWILSGRFHYYEGYSAKLASFPIRVLKMLGVKNMIITNASGSVNPQFLPGDMVLIKDHINLQPENPLRGLNDERFGPRFPDMTDTYCPELMQLFETAARKCHLEKVNKGVYVGVQGPNLETPAEYRMFNILGGDLVGMSTIPEVLVAKHMGMRILAIAMVTNLCYPPEVVRFTSVEEIISIAEKGAATLQKILLEMFKSPL